jgi:hypothetical protein
VNKTLVKSILPEGAIELCREYRRRKQDMLALRKYENHPAIPPPEAFKQNVVLHHARVYRTSILVETGTSRGDMLYACGRLFRQIYSIELNAQGVAAARHRFRKQPHIRILEGDSGVVLPEILAQVHEPAVFWLDGHYSGPGSARADRDTPIEAELAAIGDHAVRNHVILIDDAREFGTGDYPSAEALTSLLRTHYPASTIEIRDDILRCTPASEAREKAR